MKLFEPSYFPINKLLSHEAVIKYSNSINILMLNSPPCVGYMDYYAIKEYENLNITKNKYIIYIGEMGASDGATGMYSYMFNHKHWKIKHQIEIYTKLTPFGDEVTKELYFFEYI